MIRIIYDPIDGCAVPDGQAETWVGDRIDYYHRRNGIDYDVLIGTEVMINEFRLAVIDKKIKPEEMKFIFKDWTLSINEGGRIAPWPSGFCDTLCKQLSRIM